MATKAKKDSKETPTEVLLEGIENEVVVGKLEEMIEDNDIEAEIDDVLKRFSKVVNSPHCRMKVKGADKKLTYGVKTVKAQLEAGKVLSSKKTMPITCIVRHLQLEKNWANVTQDTKPLDNNDEKIGIAGSWRRCLECSKKWDTSAPDFGSNCPGCQSGNSVVLAQQPAPKGTQGVMNKKMEVGDISIYNTMTTSIFLMNSDDEIVPAFLKFTGKQQELLNLIQFGIPFDINVSAEEKDLFVNDTTGIQSFSCTGSSKVIERTKEMPDILDIYNELSEELLHSVDNCENGTYPTLYLEVVKEAEKYKDDGKWVVNLVDPGNDEDEDYESYEPMPISMYLDDENVAKEFKLGDSGIFECRFTKQTRTFGDETKEIGTINVPVSNSGMPVYLLGDEGVRLVSV